MIAARRRRAILTDTEREAARQRRETELATAAEKGRALQIVFAKPAATKVRKAIMAALAAHNGQNTPQLAKAINDAGVKASVGTVRKHLNRLADEDRIYATGVFVAPYWGLNPHFDGEPL